MTFSTRLLLAGAPIESEARLPVDYEVLIAQLDACAKTLEKLRAEEPTPKVVLMIGRLEEAQQRMFAALRSLRTPYVE